MKYNVKYLNIILLFLTFMYICRQFGINHNSVATH